MEDHLSAMLDAFEPAGRHAHRRALADEQAAVLDRAVAGAPAASVASQ